MLRIVWLAAGWIALAAGMVGAVLPLVPTVPFLILAAYCFARGSERMHHWLVTHPRFGPAIQDWRQHRAISRAGKRAAVITIALAFGLSLALGIAPEILAIQAVTLGCVLAFVLTRPGRPGRPEPSHTSDGGSSTSRKS
ncbi:MAG: YbaN family protein [Pseudomonadota bacterium]